ncbi:MAG: energy transducer TonB [Nitrospirae bacterium]|nr:energy transducer TonB [Nitrospirota bacterium]
MTHSTVETTPPVFNVNIVDPLPAENPPVPKILKPQVKKQAPPVAKRPRKIPEKLQPETLYGESAGETPKPADKPENSRDHRAAVPRTEKNNPPSRPFSKGGISESPPLEKGDTGGFSDEKAIPPSGKNDSSIVPPSTLFDKGTIEKFAKKAPPADKGLTFDIPGFKHRGYMRMLKEKIESIWHYPKEAARLGLSGELYIKFTIKKDGKLGSVELLRISGYKELDEAAMKALKDAEPYWPLPDDWEKDELEIKGHFLYVYGSGVIM